MRFGEPEDVEGQCNAHLYISDNHGDNHATMRCGLPKGHEGRHQEIFDRGSPVIVTWGADERDYAAPAKDAFDEFVRGRGLTGVGEEDISADITQVFALDTLVVEFLQKHPEHAEWEKQIRESEDCWTGFVSQDELYLKYQKDMDAERSKE